MPENIKPEVPLSELSSSLEQLAETTTAAELVRTKGQSKKVRIISEKKLMEWILSLLNMHLAGKADAFSDQEKEALLKKTQDELARRISREQAAESERDRIKGDLDRAISTLTNTTATKEELDSALAALRAKLQEEEQINQDLQQDNYDLHDQLNEKMAMVSTTIAEKERLKETVKYQMLRSNALVEGVLQLDNQLYSGRHQDNNPVGEVANEENEFYHDFDVGAQVIDTLSADLQRLRGVAQGAQEREAALESLPHLDLIESDLKLLAELKQGSLHATDVAAPVAALVEALSGARHEALLLDQAGTQVLGLSSGHDVTIAEVPDAEGVPSEVIADSTTIIRAFAATLARARQRLAGISEMTQQAEQTRLNSEQELEQLQAAHRTLLQSLVDRAQVEKIANASDLLDEHIAPAKRSAIAHTIIEQLHGESGLQQALTSQLSLVHRVLGESLPDVSAAPQPREALIAQLQSRGEAVERAIRDTKSELAAAARREKMLVEQVRSLARAHSEHAAAPANSPRPLEVRLKALDASLTSGKDAQAATEAANEVVAALKAEALAAPTLTDLTSLAEQVAQLAKAQTTADLQAHAPADAARLSQPLKRLDSAIASASAHELATSAKDVVSALASDLAGRRLIEAKRSDEDRQRLTAQIDQSQTHLVSLERELNQVRQALVQAQAQASAKKHLEKELARELVEAAKGDHVLADSSVDLALALENHPEQDETSGDFTSQVHNALTLLSKRKQALASEAERLSKDLTTARAQDKESKNRVGALETEREALTLQLAQDQQRLAQVGQNLETASAKVETLRAQVNELTAQRTSTHAERSKLVEQLDKANHHIGDLEATLAAEQKRLATLTESSNRQIASEHSVAHELVRAAEEDSDLADLTAELAIVMEDKVTPTPTSTKPGTVARHISEVVNALAKRKQELTRELEAAQTDNASLRQQLAVAVDSGKSMTEERDEMAASGKEVINLLTQQRERAHSELETLRATNQEINEQLDGLESRVTSAEHANRQLAEALSMLAGLEKDQSGVADKRLDLEMVLSQLPGEGEQSVPIPENLSLQLAATGTKLAEALLKRRQAMTSTFARAQKDQESIKEQVDHLKVSLDQAQKSLEEQQTALRTSHAEVHAMRGALTNQGAELAAKVNELSSSRSELVSLKAELGVLNQRLAEQDRRLQQATTQLHDGQRQHERISADLKNTQRDASQSIATQGQLIQALRTLINHQDASAPVTRALTKVDHSDPLSKAARKLDLAQSAGPEQVAIAGLAYVQELRDRLHHLVETEQRVHDKLASAQAEIKTLSTNFTSVSAALVDRDHQIENLSAEIKKHKHDHAELAKQSQEQLKTAREALTQVPEVADQLRAAQADLAAIHARDSSTSEHFSTEHQRLRAEREAERQLREKLETESRELAEVIAANEARLSAQREEFSRLLAERDAIIQQKDSLLDAQAVERSDIKGFEAQIATLSKELAAAHQKMKKLDSAFGANAGVATKSSELAREIKQLQAERDQLRDKHRKTESDHTQTIGLTAQLTAQLEEKRKEITDLRDRFTAELGEERNRSEAMREEFRRLKEEITSLRARLRHYSDPSVPLTGSHRKKEVEKTKEKEKEKEHEKGKDKKK